MYENNFTSGDLRICFHCAKLSSLLSIADDSSHGFAVGVCLEHDLLLGSAELGTFAYINRCDEFVITDAQCEWFIEEFGEYKQGMFNTGDNT